MKKLLVLLIVAICGIALRTPEFTQALGFAAGKETPGVQALQVDEARVPQKRMSAEEFAQLSKSDPHAYQEYLNSHVVQPVERSEVDKLMNWLSRGKYE